VGPPGPRRRVVGSFPLAFWQLVFESDSLAGRAGAGALSSFSFFVARITADGGSHGLRRPT